MKSGKAIFVFIFGVFVVAGAIAVEVVDYRFVTILTELAPFFLEWEME